MKLDRNDFIDRTAVGLMENLGIELVDKDIVEAALQDTWNHALGSYAEIADRYQKFVGKEVTEVLHVPNWFIFMFDDGSRLPYPDMRTMAIEPRGVTK